MNTNDHSRHQSSLLAFGTAHTHAHTDTLAIYVYRYYIDFKRIPQAIKQKS